MVELKCQRNDGESLQQVQLLAATAQAILISFSCSRRIVSWQAASVVSQGSTQTHATLYVDVDSMVRVRCERVGHTLTAWLAACGCAARPEACVSHLSGALPPSASLHLYSYVRPARARVTAPQSRCKLRNFVTCLLGMSK